MTNRITIQNHTPRRDVQGEVIDCHDGCLERFGERFYLYGTRYGNTDGFTFANRYVIYSSPDLQTWTPHGEMLTDAPAGVFYRPYVKYNAQLRKYVSWFNWYPTLWNGQFGVATADSPQGPFIMVEPNAEVAQPRPGDHGLFVDDDGAAYIVYTSIELGHAIAVERLSTDWLRGTGQTSEVLDKGCEAPTMFKRQGTYYVILGNTCCFCTQGADVRVYTANSPLGPYTSRGEINREATELIIPAQQTHVATIPTVNGPEFLWMGDCWGSRPDGIKGHDIQYWGSPLSFNEDGTINQLTFTKEFELVLP